VTLVLDASVILKWLLAAPEREPDTAKATALLESVLTGKAKLLQPIHWLPEVAAVLTRLSPQTAIDDVEMLSALELPTNNDSHVLRRATELAIDTGQHVFDTLYHAVALEHNDATLITADERYRLKAMSHGKILALRDWALT
jgi:predicted nucleic acid-binding protein